MSLTINTNISSILAQRSLNNATNALNTSLERLTTGYKINHAKDNAAGYSIANIWNIQLSSLDVNANNAATGADMLTTAEDSYSLLTSHLQRIRDLTEQAANGTYGSASLKSIQSEIVARMEEINRISANVEFNGIKLMKFSTEAGADNTDTGMTDQGVSLQVGLYAESNSQIKLDIDLFKDASLSGLFRLMKTDTSESGKTMTQLMTASGGDADAFNTHIQGFAAACSSLVYDDATDSLSVQTDKDCLAKEMLTFLDKAIADISDRVTQIGAAQNRVTSALTALDVQSTNITSSLSTLRDTDVAEESSNYVRAQILQQASATLLATANQTPSIALNLI